MLRAFPLKELVNGNEPLVNGLGPLDRGATQDTKEDASGRTEPERGCDFACWMSMSTESP